MYMYVYVYQQLYAKIKKPKTRCVRVNIKKKHIFNYHKYFGYFT